MSNRVYFGCGLLPGFVGLGILVLFQWAWNYFTRNRSARLITGEDLRREGC